MRDKIKSKLVDLGFLVLALCLVLGGLHLYNRLEAHNVLVKSLVDLVQAQQKAIQQQQAQRGIPSPPPAPEQK